MVVYTPLAKQREGGRAAIEALIDLFVAETNQANANSGVTHRIRLVLRDEVDYIEDGDSFIDLRRLQDDSDGYMDHVHELRDLYTADLVHIVVGRSVNVGGVAASIGGDESGGFALTVSYGGGLTFAHELGHNMGLAHDRYVLGVSVTGSNYGYVNQRMFDEGAPESARWRTIMSYPTQCSEVADFYCEQLLYFSNPEVTYGGDPMGVPADNPHRRGRACRRGENAKREEGDHSELSSGLGLAHAEGGANDVSVLAGREWRGQHGDGDVAQAIERRHDSNGVGLAVRRRHAERQRGADHSRGPDGEQRSRDDHRG